MDFNKDVVLVPYYLGKWRQTTCEFYYGKSTSKKELPSSYRNISFHCLNEKPESSFFYLKILWSILKQSKNIDTLLTFHFSNRIIILTFLLKLLNKNANVWVLGDLNLDMARTLKENGFVFSKGMMGIIKKRIVHRFFNILDVFSLETTQYYEMFKPLFEKNNWKCLTYFPCSWDEDNENSLSVLDDKENIILSCARFGSYQKNTEMLLEGIEKTDLKDWKIFLVGPISSDFSYGENSKFKDYVKDFYSRNPHFVDVVFFTGPVFDTKELFSYFQRAKVFVMTSRYEGFANVFAQARWNQCFIVSTDVGGAKDMSHDWEFGTPVEQDNSTSVSKVLQSVIDNGYKMPTREFADLISYNKTISLIVSQKLQ